MDLWNDLCLWLGRVVFVIAVIPVLFTLSEWALELCLKALKCHWYACMYVFYRRSFHRWLDKEGITKENPAGNDTVK